MCTVHNGEFLDVCHMAAWRCEKEHGKWPTSPDSSDVDVPSTSEDELSEVAQEAEQDEAGVHDEKKVAQEQKEEEDEAEEGDSDFDVSSSDVDVSISSSDDDVSFSDSSGSDADSDVQVAGRAVGRMSLKEIAARNFAREMIELLTQGKMEEALMERQLTIFHSYLGEMFGQGELNELPADINFPMTMYQLYKHADIEGMESVLLDICPNDDHYVFPADDQSWIQFNNKISSAPERKESAEDNEEHKERPTHCPLCQHPRSSKRQLLVCGVVKQLQCILRTPALARVQFFYSTLLSSTLLYSTLLYSTLLYSTRLDSTRLYSTLLYSTISYPYLNFNKTLK
jgi:hypothetical protein